MTEFSEPGGFFRSDNFVSNETSFQYVIPELQRTTQPGGVYLGVAPDQNFTYLVALKPRIAFIVDIRRQNMIHHLMYKAMIEMAPTAPSSWRCCSRARVPTGLEAASTAGSAVQRVRDVAAGHAAVREKPRGDHATG